MRLGYKKYEFIEHTADIAVRVFGASHKALFIHAAQALGSLLLEQAPLASSVTRKISLEAQIPEDLLGYWLNELISLFYTEQFIAVSFDLKLTRDGPLFRLTGTLYGDKLDGYTVKNEVKAATYHDIHIRKIAGEYTTDIVFDA